jgi:ubiquinone/menaquinone biosynthesis C-methylase UbiE
VSKKEITAYYNALAKDYDQDRFSNTYGAYIHAQEFKVVQKALSSAHGPILDIACGTGRFLPFATHGVDISENMIEVAQNKFPDKDLKVADAESLPFEDQSVEHALAFHLFMHLDTSTCANILKDVARVLKPGGQFIVDIPSGPRRKFVGNNQRGWHGAYQISPRELQVLAGPQWKLRKYRGIAFFPIHRIPKGLRAMFIWIDSLLGSSPLRAYSSHLIFILERQ